MSDSGLGLLLFSPAGVLRSVVPLRRAAARLGKLGFSVSIDEAAASRMQRFAGDDETRLAALHRIAAFQPGVALATRGGYGLTRLLDRIDWKRIVRSVPSVIPISVLPSSAKAAMRSVPGIPTSHM